MNFNFNVIFFFFLVPHTRSSLQHVHSFVVSCRLLLPERKSLFMEGEDVAEKTLVHKTAVK